MIAWRDEPIANEHVPSDPVRRLAQPDDDTAPILALMVTLVVASFPAGTTAETAFNIAATAAGSPRPIVSPSEIS